MKKNAVIDIAVIPKSSKSIINLESDGTFRVKLNSPPVDGKANEECIKLFAKTLGLPKNAVSIIKGEKGRRKRLSIAGLTEQELIERISKPD